MPARNTGQENKAPFFSGKISWTHIQSLAELKIKGSNTDERHSGGGRRRRRERGGGGGERMREGEYG